MQRQRCPYVSPVERGGVLLRRWLIWAAATILAVAIVSVLVLRMTAVTTQRLTVLKLPVHTPVSISFPLPSTGWLSLGTYLLHTDNGGGYWQVEQPPIHSIIGVQFINADQGWTWTGQALAESLDGGTTWIQRSDPGHFQAVHFLSATHGWAVGQGALWLTSDAGRTWSKPHLPAAIQSACFVNGNAGWIASGTDTAGRALWYTDTAGASWVNRSLPNSTAVGLAWMAANSSPSSWSQDLGGCAGPDTIWDQLSFGGYAGGEGYAVFQSTDGGNQWHAAGANPPLPPLPGLGLPILPAPSPVELYVVSSTTAYMTGFCGACPGYPGGDTTIAVTSKGGRAWHSVVLPGVSGGDPLVAAPSVNIGWAVVTQPVYNSTPAQLYETPNGGRTWIERTINIRS